MRALYCNAFTVMHALYCNGYIYTFFTERNDENYENDVQITPKTDVKNSIYLKDFHLVRDLPGYEAYSVPDGIIKHIITS